MVWAEVKQLWEEGFVKYVSQWWNWLDFIMMALYMSTFALRGSYSTFYLSKCFVILFAVLEAGGYIV